MVGSYITVVGCCAILQSSRALLIYSGAVAAIAASLLLRQPELSYVVFLPGLLTNLLLANIGFGARFRLLERLRETHARVESLFDAGFDGIVLHDAGTIRQVNGALAAMLGYSKAELEGRPLELLVAAGSRAQVNAIQSQVSDAPREMTATTKGGTRFVVEVLSKHHQLEGRAMRLLALRDLTERRRAENAMARAHRGLESFSYSVAHDLRSPLRAVNGFSRVLLDDHSAQLDADGKHLLEGIANASQKMGHLIDALLELARIGRRELKRETVELSREAAAVAEQLRGNRPERTVELIIQPDLIAQGDPRLLRTVLDNLLGNAWKFTEHQPAPRIELGKTMRDGVPIYFVRDNGAGFDVAHAGKLFGPFQRLHNAAEFPGTGIGLATVHRIIEAHGGQIWAEAVVGQGATFFFTLETTGASLAPPPPSPAGT